jgi:hypothetical protein
MAANRAPRLRLLSPPTSLAACLLLPAFKHPAFFSASIAGSGRERIAFSVGSSSPFSCEWVIV